MSSNVYPEKRPDAIGPISSFKFSLAGLEGVQKDMDLQVEALSERLRKINEMCMLGPENQEMTVIDKILHITHDAKQLVVLGKGLQRVAEFIEEYDKKVAKSQVLKFAKDDPNFFTWAFADFEDEIDTGLDELFTEGTPIDES